MSLFLVLTVPTNITPSVGEVVNAQVYVGDHTTGDEAATAGSNAMSLKDGVSMWALDATSIVHYTNSTVVTRSVAAG